MKPPILVIVDLETTGTDVAADDIVQLAAVMCRIKEDGTPNARTLMLSYCNPTVDIHPEAEKIHGISKETVQYAPSSEWSLRTLKMLLTELEQDFEVILSGYNSQRFDIPMMDNRFPQGTFAQFPHIDAYTVALRMFPDLYTKFENPREYRPHKLEKMYDWYVGGDAANAHDAAADCHMASWVLGKMLHEKKIGIKAAAEWCSKAEILPCIPYGKYGGMPWSEVPKGYLSYCRKTWSDTHQDVMLSLLSATAVKI